MLRTFRYHLTAGLQPSDAARLHLGLRGALVLERKLHVVAHLLTQRPTLALVHAPGTKIQRRLFG